MEVLEAETQAACDREQLAIQRQAIELSARQYARGQWIAGLLGILGIGGGVACTLMGEGAAGITTVIVAVSGLAVAFVYGRRREPKPARTDT